MNLILMCIVRQYLRYLMSGISDKFHEKISLYFTVVVQ